MAAVLNTATKEQDSGPHLEGHAGGDTSVFLASSGVNMLVRMGRALRGSTGAGWHYFSAMREVGWCSCSTNDKEGGSGRGKNWVGEGRSGPGGETGRSPHSHIPNPLVRL